MFHRIMAATTRLRPLARTGYEAQQTDAPENPSRPHNLWHPVPGDHGAYGDFGKRAYASSPQLWATTHRGWLALAGVGVAGLLTAALWRKGRQQRQLA